MIERPSFRDLEHNTRFTFVRHGESEANKLNIIQGHSDSPLSEVGRKHARAAGQWLTGTEIDLILTSPLSRSHETAKIVAEEAGTSTPEVLEELKELDTGVYSGKTLHDSSQEDPEAFKSFLVHSWEIVDGAESRESILSRALVVWDRLVTEANGGRRHIVCVTHGGMLQWIIKATIGVPDQRWMPIFAIANCGISTFSAESTSLGHDEALRPNTGFYGNWEQINYVPY
ncbi:MAG: histidine phosphatase family protein [Spirochaetales bacterium]|nr:histidine phosphatase family protein [Spirochaetales bacterium]